VELKPGQSVTIKCQDCHGTIEGIPYAEDFRLPMANLGQPWYEATRRFGAYDYHPDRCEDFNLESGGDTDLGEPLVAPFSGIVLNARDWGNRIGNIVQLLGVARTGELVVWAGWHLKDMAVSDGQVVRIGDSLGSIGNAGGQYSAHLHNQICITNMWSIPTPNTYVGDTRYKWVQPSIFYIEHGVDPALVKRVCEWDGA